MGPSLFSDGRQLWAEAFAEYSDGASMGPSLFSDGRMGTAVRRCVATGFNGAVAVQRRKGRVRNTVKKVTSRLQWGRRCSATEGAKREGTTRYVSCFNGAVAVQRRKVRESTKAGKKAAAASMGPSLFSDGRASKVCSTAECETWLQWGRRCSATEGHLCDGRGAGGPPASMGPSLFSDGRRSAGAIWAVVAACFNGAVAVQRRKAAHRRHGRRDPAASMGPSLFSDGRRLRGHERPVEPFGLQWGRRCSATEGRLLDPTGRRHPRFNGAVAVQRRKAACS